MSDLYQQIQTLIESLNERPSFSAIRRLVKLFSQYTNL